MEVTEGAVHFFKNSLPLICNFTLGLIFFGGIASNLLVLLVFHRKPGLRTIANRFVINLMIINVVACLSLLPVSFADNSTAGHRIYVCFAEQFSSVFCSSVIVYSVLLIGIDQYFAVLDPLHYHYIISSWKGYFMIISTWGFSAILAFLGSIQPDFGPFRSSIFRQCVARSDEIGDFQRGSNSSLSESEESRERAPMLYRTVFCFTYITTSFVIPFALICIIYYKICAAASGNSKRTRTSVLASEDSTQALREKFGESVSDSSEKSGRELARFADKKNDEKSEKVSGEQVESFSLLGSESHECSPTPLFVVTRPSPPRPSVPQDPQVPLLKPTLKSNASFSKLSSVHIQFSNSTENIGQGTSTERRHSNVPFTIKDPEFENISKNRSPSVQSNFYEIPARSCSSAKSSASASVHIQSSRSSSLNSTCPPSRASSIRSTSSYIVHNIRHRISNASLFRYREEARAARISALVIVMALFCWLPFFAAFALHSGVFTERHPPFAHYFDALSTVLLLLSTVVSPCLFAFRNSQIKKEIRKIFQYHPATFKSNCKKSFYKHNFSLSLNSQTVRLFTELGNNVDVKQTVLLS